MVEPGRVGGAPGGPGYDVVERVVATIQRHGMVAGGGEPIVVAVSGGPDSMCLLDVLARCAPRWGLEISVVHVDHGLSEASAEVAARVSHVGAQAGFDVHVARASDLEGPNLHARARAFRYEFFDIIASRVGADRIATGHTLDDRVETTLARLVHGASLRGLAGIPPVEGNRIRPLIDLRRSATRAYCQERALEVYDDAANADERFERVRIRTGVLQLIEEDFGEGAIRAIARSTELLREDAVMLEELADGLFGRLAQQRDGTTVFDLDAFKGIPKSFRRRLLERAVGEVRDRAAGIDAALEGVERGTKQRPARFAVAEGIEITLEESEILVSRMRS